MRFVRYVRKAVPEKNFHSVVKKSEYSGSFFRQKATFLAEHRNAFLKKASPQYFITLF